MTTPEKNKMKENPTLTQTGLQMLEHGKIRPSPTNPRKKFDAVALRELADSILEHGIVQPVLVRPVPARFKIHEPSLLNKRWKLIDTHNADQELEFGSEQQARTEAGAQNLEPYFEIVAGERRWRAAGLAVISPIPVIVRNLTDSEVLEIQYIENLQRQDLTALEEGEGFAKLIGSGKYTADTLAEKLGISRSAVFGRLKLTRLLAPVREALEADQIKHSIAERIAQVPGLELQKKLLKQAVTGRWAGQGAMSVAGLEELIEEDYTAKLKGAPFDQADAKLDPKAGACASCPKRSGNMKEMFPDIGSPDVCTDVECFRGKQALGVEQKLLEAAAQGQRVVSAKDYAKTGYGVYTEASETCYEDGKRRSYKQCAGKSEVKPILTVNRSGALIEVFDKRDLNTIKKALPKQAERKDSPKEEERKERMKFMERVAVEARSQLIRTAARPIKKFDMAFLRSLLHLLALQNEFGMEEAIDKFWPSLRHEKNLKIKDEAHGVQVFMQRAKELESEENYICWIVGLLVEAHVNYDAKLDPTFTDACRVFGVDVVKVERELEAKEKGGAAAKAKPEVKKAAKAGKGAKK